MKNRTSAGGSVRAKNIRATFDRTACRLINWPSITSTSSRDHDALVHTNAAFALLDQRRPQIVLDVAAARIGDVMANVVVCAEHFAVVFDKVGRRLHAERPGELDAIDDVIV